MLTFKLYVDQIYETVLSIGLNKNHEKYREEHRHEIHDILRNSYKSVDGGYSGMGHGTKEESDAIHSDISKSHIKAVKRGGKITAVRLYKDSHGRKAIGGGTDGSAQGKKDFIKIGSEDHSQKRAWAEVSGAPEHLARKMGAPIIPNSQAEKLTGKKITDLDPDGEHYTRKIGTALHKKVIVGHPKMD